MHYTYDPQADALYVYLKEEAAVDKTILIDDQRHLDLDDEGGVVGIEILCPGTGFPVQDLIDRYGLSDFKEFLESIASTGFKPVMPAAP